MEGKVLCLFDVDGTLTAPRQVIQADMKEFLQKLRTKAVVGLVGGSDLVKIEEQMDNGARQACDFVFAENGLTAFQGTTELKGDSVLEFLGEARLKQFINFTLHYIADLDIPQKRGTFIEFRKGMLNVSPIGRNCSRDERNAFEQFDHEHHIRATMVKVLQARFPDFGLKYSIGGQISFDVFPLGWDKTYCLKHVRDRGFKEIHFFGDKTFEGGNDFEIFSSPETIGHTVTSPADTMKQVAALFGL
eukprot:m.225684 g.225684  ORF g.225684 m.225684 type:complete len:246 (-) comp16757_c0_seq1:279-1016(-)